MKTAEKLHTQKFENRPNCYHKQQMFIHTLKWTIEAMSSNQYPHNDDDFEEVTIFKIENHCPGYGWMIIREDGRSFDVPADSPVVPQIGMVARFYGRGIGYPVRGLYLDHKLIYYRNEQQDREYQDEQRYGKDAADWLSRWDKSIPVWSLEMGGIGPGYEQAIQITTAEILRVLLAEQMTPERWAEPEYWSQDRERINRMVAGRISGLGLTGAQFEAALSLAAQIYRRGPIAVMNDEETKNRHIQVSRQFPRLEVVL